MEKYRRLGEQYSLAYIKAPMDEHMDEIAQLRHMDSK